MSFCSALDKLNTEISILNILNNQPINTYFLKLIEVIESSESISIITRYEYYGPIMNNSSVTASLNSQYLFSINKQINNGG